MPRLGLGSIDVSSLGGTGQDVVTAIDDFFFESDTSGEVTPIYTASRKQFARNNNDVAGLNNVTKDTSITVPPGQTGTAIRLTEDTSNSQHFATTVIDEVTAGDTYTMSLYVKSTYSQIIIYTNTSQISSNVTVNFTNETISTNALRAGIEDAGGGWYRVNWTQVAQASASSIIYLVVKDLSAYTGSTSNFTDYFGMQVEQDSRASSFMLNTTSDVLTVSTTLNDTSEVWDFDSTDIMLEADPEDEGFWEEGSNVVLNHDYEELGSNLITNSTFADTSDWAAQDGNISLSVVGGEGKVTMIGGSTYIHQTFNTTSGKVYEGSLDFRAGDNVSTGQVQLRSGNNSGSSMNAFFTQGSRASDASFRSVQVTNGTGTFMFTADNSSTAIRLISNKSDTPANSYWDNIVIKEVDPNNRWARGTGWSIFDGKAVHDGTSGAHNLTQNGILTVGDQYELTVTVSDYVSGSVQVTAGAQYHGSSSVLSANGTYTLIQTCSPTTNLFLASSSFNGKIDNVTVREHAIRPLDV